MSWFQRLFSKPLFNKQQKAYKPPAGYKHPAEGRGHGTDEHGRRKSERAMAREQLHEVVRECMSTVGVLSSHYKFKVLTVDRESTQFVVLMDMLKLVAPDRDGLTDMEAHIAHRAMSLRGMRVIAVYWRMTDQASLTKPRPTPASHAPSARSEPSMARTHAPRERSRSGFPDTDPRALGGTQYGDVN